MGVAAQNVYRTVAPDGRVTFSDTPPTTPGKVTPVTPGSRDTDAQGTGLPYELRQIVGKYPVTLYTSAACAPCDDGRNLLRKRGVPFSEKTITTSEDAESLKNLSNSAALPILTVGALQLKGFSSQEWTQYLDAAAYPERSKLAPGYRHPAATPLVAVQAPAVPATTSGSPAESQAKPAVAAPPRVNTSNPAGIVF
jgi:glutaredoxin